MGILQVKMTSFGTSLVVQWLRLCASITQGGVQIRSLAPVALVVKNPPANADELRDVKSLPGSGRCPRGGHGNPLRYSCLKNPMDRGAWGHKESDLT